MTLAPISHAPANGRIHHCALDPEACAALTEVLPARLAVIEREALRSSAESARAREAVSELRSELVARLTAAEAALSVLCSEVRSWRIEQLAIDAAQDRKSVALSGGVRELRQELSWIQKHGRGAAVGAGGMAGVVAIVTWLITELWPVVAPMLAK